MAETDFDRLTRVMLGEFNRVHERLDEHDERFDAIDRRFDRMGEEFARIHAELKQLRTDVDDLSERVGNTTGYRKEIDHALTRIAAIEKHLGIR
jgi:tetrahydromethanopterin S-methyltransferase subunit G